MPGPNLATPAYHGTQNIARWAAGQAGSRPLCAIGMPPDSQNRVAPLGLWRASFAVVRSNPAQLDAPTLNVTWGAGHASQQLNGVLLPAVILSPGYLTVNAVLTAAATSDLEVVCQVTPVHSGCCERVITLHDATAAPVLLPPTVYRLTALAAATVTPFGAPAPIAVAAGAQLEVLGQPATLNTGVAYAEHVL